MKILVVDDSQAMRKIIRNALEDMGYSASSVVEACDGVDAMRQLGENLFNVDLILADWNMPIMDGLTFLRQLRGVEMLRKIPFIMVTDETHRARVVEVINAGARDYIVKPFTPETLRQKILAVEMTLLAERKPTDTAVFRLHAPKVAERPDSELPFMAQLPKDLVVAIYDSASRSEHGRGETLVERGDVVRSLHIVDSGEVEILPSGNGRSGNIRGRGECFGELSFLSGDPAGLSACARTKIAALSVEKGDFEDLLAEFPQLSFYLTRLLAKRARKADAKLNSEMEKGFSGKLSTIAIPDLVQTLHSARKTGLLRIESNGDVGEVHFLEGNVTHACVGERSGEEAFYRVMSWREGNFAFESGPRQIEHGILRATMGLLIEGMRRQDELRFAVAGACSLLESSRAELHAPDRPRDSRADRGDGMRALPWDP
jgi:two-component system chemotaxis response regulator CheY